MWDEIVFGVLVVGECGVVVECLGLIDVGVECVDEGVDFGVVEVFVGDESVF